MQKECIFPTQRQLSLNATRLGINVAPKVPVSAHQFMEDAYCNTDAMLEYFGHVTMIADRTRSCIDTIVCELLTRVKVILMIPILTPFGSASLSLI
jgi:hypothetical protein